MCEAESFLTAPLQKTIMKIVIFLAFNLLINAVWSLQYAIGMDKLLVSASFY